jgi:hypothetical protein
MIMFAPRSARIASGRSSPVGVGDDADDDLALAHMSGLPP